jgi:hypothetical protein
MPCTSISGREADETLHPARFQGVIGVYHSNGRQRIGTIDGNTKDPRSKNMYAARHLIAFASPIDARKRQTVHVSKSEHPMSSGWVAALEEAMKRWPSVNGQCLY